MTAKGTRRWTPASYWVRVAILGPDQCWPWIGAINDYGYGLVWRDGRRIMAHRVGYELAHGHLPIGVVDHTCHNTARDCAGGIQCQHRRCQNPAHLLDTTQGDNLRASPHTRAGKRARRAI